VPFVSWVQDLYSSAMAQYLGARFGLPGRLIAHRYARLEASILRSSAAVIAISEGFSDNFRLWGVSRDKITVIPNWAPLAELPVHAKDNAWARQHGLEGALVAMYTGTLGLRHDPSLLCDLARQGRAQGLTVVVTAAGPHADWLAAAALDNLIVLPFQPMEVYAQVLGAADVLLVLLGQEAAGFSIPSKVLSYLAAGKPIVASVSEDNDAARTLISADAGFVVAPADRAGFIDRVLDLAGSPEQRLWLGRNGRAFAEANFDIGAIAVRFDAVLSSVTGRPDA
jgi:glycosyltransferase involved in cell wall biosynthesis